MLCGFQSNLRYNTSTIFVLLRSINKTLCMYILDWNCFHNNVSSFQSLPFSRSFREIRSEGKWVPYSAYSLRTVFRLFNFPQHFVWTRTMRRGLQVFFIPRRLESLTVCRWHGAALLVSYFKILIDNCAAGVWNRGFPLIRPVFIHLELTGRRFNSAVFHYKVNLRLSRQKWEF